MTTPTAQINLREAITAEMLTRGEVLQSLRAEASTLARAIVAGDHHQAEASASFICDISAWLQTNFRGAK